LALVACGQPGAGRTEAPAAASSASSTAPSGPEAVAPAGPEAAAAPSRAEGAAAPAGSEAAAPAAPAGSQAAPAAGSVRDLDVTGLKSDLDAKKVPLLVDVRTPGEYQGGHVPGAVNIPLQSLPERMNELAGHRDQPVYVICEVGGRSAQAARQLADKGFQAVNITGGTRAWREAGNPVE
jgi:rhodanese-related sulfurtransferase